MIENSKYKDGVLRYQHLLGREYIPGTHDCFSILQDIFWDNLEIPISNYARPTDWWLIEGLDLYRDNFLGEGFEIVEIRSASDFQPLDVALIAIPDSRASAGAVKPNHCAIYVGDGKVVHHRPGNLSQVLPYTHYLKDMTSMVVRHKAAPKMVTQKIQQTDVMDYILPHKREQLLGVLNERS